MWSRRLLSLGLLSIAAALPAEVRQEKEYEYIVVGSRFHAADVKLLDRYLTEV